MPYQHKRRMLPEILAPEEVAAFFDACCNIKQHAPLMTADSGGPRIYETLALVPADVDSKRMLI